MDVFNRQQRGKQAEDEACRFLESKNMRLLQPNYRCYFGEIDLIMLDREDIVFVEVRSKSRTDYGSASESINHNKKIKLVKTATHFLQMKKWVDKVNSRFDVIAIHFIDGKRELEWFKNAF